MAVTRLNKTTDLLTKNTGKIPLFRHDLGANFEL